MIITNYLKAVFSFISSLNAMMNVYKHPAARLFATKFIGKYAPFKSAIKYVSFDGFSMKNLMLSAAKNNLLAAKSEHFIISNLQSKLDATGLLPFAGILNSFELQDLEQKISDLQYDISQLK